MEIIGYLIIVLLAALIVVSLVSAYENRHFIVRRYTVHSKRLPEAFDGYRMAVVSDLHNQQFGPDNESLLAAIDEACPDMVVGAGDLLVGKPDTDFTPAAALVRQLSHKYPIYLALGNHEYRLKIYPDTYGQMWEQYVRATQETEGDEPVVWLDNETALIKRKGQQIAITGLSIDRSYYKRFQKHEMSSEYVAELCPAPDQDTFHILLAHNPDYFPAYADYGADLVISGHVHGGMVRLPFLGGVISPTLRLFPKYDQGHFTLGSAQMILSAGLGSHTIRFRVNNRPELAIIVLKKDA